MKTNNKLQFQDLTPEEKERRGILGRLIGPCASISIPTRNGRLYSESLWDKVFKNEITQEMFENGGIPMELDHPTDREDTCSDRIAAMLPQKPEKDENGHLICCADIIDTPCGRIAYQLAKYGFNLGISSRGTGDIIEGLNGEEEVDADTYDFKTFDLVLLPAVKDARLKLMTESLNGKTFKQAIKESIDESTPDERKVMTEVLDKLNIEYTMGDKPTDIDSNSNKSNVAENNGTELIEELQKALEDKSLLESKIVELNETLSVSYTKEMKMREENDRMKATVINLTEQVKQLKAQKKQFESINESYESKNTEFTKLKNKYSNLLEDYQNIETKNEKLTERLQNKQEVISSLESQVKVLEKSKSVEIEKMSNENQSLKEDVAEIKKNTLIKTKEYSDKLSKANQLVEQYKTIAKKAVDKYIESKAITLGVSASEIKNKLSENYSFSDIDKICESLNEYKVHINSLPFNVDRKTNLKVQKSVENASLQMDSADDINDPQLKALCGL